MYGWDAWKRTSLCSASQNRAQNQVGERFERPARSCADREGGAGEVVLRERDGFYVWMGCVEKNELVFGFPKQGPKSSGATV